MSERDHSVGALIQGQATPPGTETVFWGGGGGVTATPQQPTVEGRVAPAANDAILLSH